MKILKRLVLSAATILAVVSCEKDKLSDAVEFTATDGYDIMDQAEAERQFAILLSKAVTTDASLREFIKTEALKQFDCDYDVFYAFVKDLKVDGERTFRDIILDVAETEDQLVAIEQSLPKMTILVPDFSWVSSTCFSVNKWDTSSHVVAVGYDDRLDSHPLFYNGELIGSMPATEFPSFPVLIIKDNERMKVLPATKSGDSGFDFADPVFDGSKKKTKADHGLWGDIDEQLPNEENSGNELVSVRGNAISPTELMKISPEAINAYYEFKDVDNDACQRDYVYYGMTKANANNGRLKLNERDMIYRFSFIRNTLWTITDADGEDPVGMKNGFQSRNKDLPGCADAVRRMWGNGQYEIRLQIYQWGRNDVNMIQEFIFDVAPSELMYVTHCNRNYHWNMIGQSWNTYGLDMNYIEPKWYYPAKNGLVTIQNNWNLRLNSDSISIIATEYDQSVEITDYADLSFKKTNNVTRKSETGVEGAIKFITVKTGYGVSESEGTESTNETRVSYTRKQDTDILGTFNVNYTDPIIAGKSPEDYYLHCYNSGRFKISVLPIKQDNEEEIYTYIQRNHK